MKKATLLAFAISSLILTACSKNTVKAITAPTNVQNIPASAVTTPSELPKNVTALCMDGSYSTQPIDNACLGFGGVKVAILRYHSE